MRTSKIDRHFLIRWVGIGFVVGIGLTLETRLSIPDNLFRFTSVLVGLALEYLLLIKYFNNARLFVVLAAIWVVLSFLAYPFVESVAMIFSQNAQAGFSPFVIVVYSIISSLLLRIGQSLILRREFSYTYLWVIGNIVAGVAHFFVSLAIIRVMAQNPIHLNLPIVLLRLLDPISLGTFVLSFGISYLIAGSTLSIIINNPKNILETI